MKRLPYWTLALAEGVEGTVRVQVRENPVRTLDLQPADASATTGDVLQLEAVPRDADGPVVDDVALTYWVVGAGTAQAETVITAEQRRVQQEIGGVGPGLISHHPSSDLRVFEGADGRDDQPVLP